MSAWTDQIFAAGQVDKVTLSDDAPMTFRSTHPRRSLRGKSGRGDPHMALIGEQYVIVCDRNGTINVVC